MLKGVKGPDRVLYSLVSTLQSKLPATISQYNTTHKEIVLFDLPGGSITFDEDFVLRFNLDQAGYGIVFAAGTYNLAQIRDTINAAETPLEATDFSYGLLLSAAKSIKFLDNFGTIKSGQVVNNVALQMPNSIIINGVLPDEGQIKAYPSIVVELANISPSADTIMCSYQVNLTIGVTSAINTSQVDYLTGQLMRYYDCISDVLTVQDNGSLGGTVNGLNILNASIGEATGNSYFLSNLTTVWRSSSLLIGYQIFNSVFISFFPFFSLFFLSFPLNIFVSFVFIALFPTWHLALVLFSSLCFS